MVTLAMASTFGYFGYDRQARITLAGFVKIEEVSILSF